MSRVFDRIDGIFRIFIVHIFNFHLLAIALAQARQAGKKLGTGGRDRSTARLTLGVGLAVSAFPLSVPV